MALPDSLSSIIKLTLPWLLLIFWACVSEINEPVESTLTLDNFIIDYDQISHTLFLQAGDFQDRDLETVQVQVTADDNSLNTSIILNDDGIEGDILAQNGIYSKLIEIELSYLKHQFTVLVESEDGESIIQSKTIHISEPHQAEIGDLVFWKRFTDGKSYQPFENIFPINAEEITYLDFQVTIKDKNGLENIQYVKYSLETDWNYAQDETCSCPQLQCLFEHPVFYMESVSSNDSMHVFGIFNEHIKEAMDTEDCIENNSCFNQNLGFPIAPTSSCNRFGYIYFNITVSDIEFGPVTKQYELFFTNCVEGNWNCDEECDECPANCPDCS